MTIEDKLDQLKYNEDAIEKLYARLNQVYDSIDMKSGLILIGFNSVMGGVMPYLKERK